MQFNRQNTPIVRFLKQELKDCKTVLDLGCGQTSMIQYIPNIEHSVGVEAFLPYIVESEKFTIHNEYVNMDITKYETPRDSFDSVICIDVLEHLSKHDAVKLIQDMKSWCKKKVIVVTPNGFIEQDDSYNDNNEFQKHLCGFTSSELNLLGFDVIGLGGWKKLRGNTSQIVSPKGLHYVYSGISKISELFCETHPEYAFSLMGIFNK